MALKVPLPMVVSVAEPESVMVAPMLPVAVTVNVVLTAWAPVHTSDAKTKFENIRFIGLLESSTLELQDYGGNLDHAAPRRVPIRRADFKSLPLARALVYSHLPASFGSIRHQWQGFDL